MNWKPMFALPNLHLREPVEVDGFAIVGWNDARLISMARANPRFDKFLGSFKTEFGDQLEPALIIRRSDSPETYRSVPAISGFRDAIALSIVPMAWARSLRYGHNFSGALYSDFFAVYPWMIDSRYKEVITRTPHMFGIHELQRLRPQSEPALSTYFLESSHLDRPLLRCLLDRWQRCFSQKTPHPDDERLFRSLNMANAAARMPAGADFNLYDTLRSVALWASAFEILRPAKSQAYLAMYQLLDTVTWNSAACRDDIYQCKGDSVGKLRKLPHWLYGEITQLRNDTLHGNPIPDDRLTPGAAKRAISMAAAPLYRVVLAAALELKPIIDPQSPEIADPDASFYSDFEFKSYQRDIEAALGAILKSDDELKQRRRQTRRLNGVDGTES